MKKKIITISITLVLAVSIGLVLANNKAKIDAAARPDTSVSVVPVKAWQVKEDSFNSSFTINGTTIPDRVVNIASEVQGKLVSLYINNGDQVRAGQVIASLDASVLRAQLVSINASLAKSRLDIERYERLVQMGGATMMQLENFELNHKSLEAQRQEIVEQIAHMQIRAPFSGKVENVKVETGSFVSFGTVLAELIDNSSLKINVFVSEQEAFRVKLKQDVTLNSIVLSASKKGHVSMISDKADATGKFLIEISFNNTGKDVLKAGLLTDVVFNSSTNTIGLSIPVSALVGTGKQAKVFVINNNKVEERMISTGIQTPDRVLVTEGLRAGELVVTSGQLNLENGSAISIIK